MTALWPSLRKTILVALIAIGAACAVPVTFGLAGYRFYLNTTPSVPTGIYMVHIGAKPQNRTELFTFYPPAGAAKVLYGRGWLAPGAPLTKQAAGLPGDIYCVERKAITVRGRYLGPVSDADSTGFRLDHLEGCTTVPPRHYLPLGLNAPNSYDGRYFGPVSDDLVVGTARLVLALPAEAP